MNKEDYKKFSKALFFLSGLRTYPNGRNLDFVESKFLNYFGKVIGELQRIFAEFYLTNKKKESLKDVAKILKCIDELKEVKKDEV